LAVPSHQRKKKKGFDVEAYLKREMARVQREIQVKPTYNSNITFISKFYLDSSLKNNENSVKQHFLFGSFFT